MRTLLHKVHRDLLARPLRGALAVVGVAIGVAGIVAIVSTSWNVTRAQREVFDDASQADLTYWVWDAPPSLVPLLLADERIERAELRVSYLTRWRLETDGASDDAASTWRDIELLGLDDLRGTAVNQFALVAGEYADSGEVMLDRSAADAVGLRDDDLTGESTILVRDAAFRQRRLTLRGITRSPSHLSSSVTQVDVGYLPASSLRQMLPIEGSNQLLVRLRDPTQRQAVERRVAQLLRRQGIPYGAPQVRSPDTYPGKRELDALVLIMLLFSVLGIVLSALLVATTLSATVAEQSGEIATLKTLGATRGYLVALYATGAMVYGLAGTVGGLPLGALLGSGLLRWIANLANATVRYRLPPAAAGIGVAVGVCSSLVGSLPPTLRAARVPVRRALEAYGIGDNVARQRLVKWVSAVVLVRPRPKRPQGRSRVAGAFSWLAALATMAMRNQARRQRRTLLTVSVVALSTSAFLAAVTTKASLDAAIDEIYVTYAADAWTWFGESLGVQMAEGLAAVPGVERAEGWGIADGVVGLARARLWGLPADTILYRPVLASGRWYRAGEPDAVVLSEELANDQGLEVGDLVEVQATDRWRTMRVVGIAIDNTIFLGGTLSGKAFMPRSTLSSLQGRGDEASFFALGLTDRSATVANAVSARIENRLGRWRPTVQPIQEEISAAQEASRLLTVALGAMVALVGITGAVGVLNTLTLNVLDRRREIAVLRSIGATNAAITVTFLAEGLALGLLGWILGALLGYPAGRLFSAQLGTVLFRMGFRITPWHLLGSGLYALGLAAVASLGPAIGAAQTSTSAALRYE